MSREAVILEASNLDMLELYGPERELSLRKVGAGCRKGS
jgi:hypothetical protein